MFDIRELNCRLNNHTFTVYQLEQCIAAACHLWRCEYMPSGGYDDEFFFVGRDDKNTYVFLLNAYRKQDGTFIEVETVCISVVELDWTLGKLYDAYSAYLDMLDMPPEFTEETFMEEIKVSDYDTFMSQVHEALSE